MSEAEGLPEPGYTWKSIMTVGVVTGLFNRVPEKTSYKASSILFEGINVLLAFVYTMANMAGKKVGSQPSMASELVLNEAIDMFCRASGAAALLAHTWATRWKPGFFEIRHPESLPEGCMALSEFMLLEAQILAGIKAEKRGMSLATQIKVQRAAAEKAYAVASQFKDAKTEKDHGWSDSMLAYIIEGRVALEAVVFKRWAAQCHSEDKNGMAVACMAKAYNLMTLNLRDPKTPSWSKIKADYYPDMKSLLENYTRMNNNITYEKIPTEDEMIGALPPSTMVVEQKAFNLPSPIEVGTPLTNYNYPTPSAPPTSPGPYNYPQGGYPPPPKTTGQAPSSSHSSYSGLDFDLNS